MTTGTFVAIMVVAATSPSYATISGRIEPCMAARRTVVTGRVLDREGHAVAGVSVIATPVASGHATSGMTVVSDRLGQFRLVGLPPGDYWFIGIHGDYPFGITPALPVSDRLEVAITLDAAVTSA